MDSVLRNYVFMLTIVTSLTLPLTFPGQGVDVYVNRTEVIGVCEELVIECKVKNPIWTPISPPTWLDAHSQQITDSNHTHRIYIEHQTASMEYANTSISTVNLVLTNPSNDDNGNYSCTTTTSSGHQIIKSVIIQFLCQDSLTSDKTTLLNTIKSVSSPTTSMTTTTTQSTMMTTTTMSQWITRNVTDIEDTLRRTIEPDDMNISKPSENADDVTQRISVYDMFHRGIQDKDAGLAIGIILAVMAAGACTVAILYRRRKKAKKSTYITFGNPSYSQEHLPANDFGLNSPLTLSSNGYTVLA